VFDETLKLMHPFTPFITEELWRVTGEQGPKRETLLISAAWPAYAFARDSAAEAEMNWVKTLITEVRSVRAEMNVPPAAKLPLQLKSASAAEAEWLARHNDLILRMARLEKAATASELAKGSAQIVVGTGTAGLALEGAIDFAKERARLTKEQQKAEGEIARIDQKLANKEFVAKAPEEVVQELRDKREEYAAQWARLAEALKRVS
jgi:valyl-tRNA synthetase